MILITGINGLLGTALAFTGLAKGHKIHGIDIETKEWLTQKSQIDSSKLNLLDLDQVHNQLQKLQPQVVIHTAAYTNVDWCENHPDETYRLHIEASENLALWCKRNDCSFVYVSTPSVFDGKIGQYSEEDKPNPLNIYAKTKLQGEDACRAQHPSLLITRGDIYGWSPRNQGLVNWLHNELKDHKPVPGFDDIQFSPILVQNYAQQIYRLLEHKKSGLYHIGSHDTCDKYYFARSFADIFGFPSHLVHAEKSRLRFQSVPRPSNTSINVQKIESDLKSRMPKVEEGLRELKMLLHQGYIDQFTNAQI